MTPVRTLIIPPDMGPGAAAPSPGCAGSRPRLAACPTCGGPVASVLRRAWCIRPYDIGGCGSFFQWRGGSWTKNLALSGRWFE